MTTELQVKAHLEAYEANHGYPLFHVKGVIRALQGDQGFVNVYHLKK